MNDEDTSVLASAESWTLHVQTRDGFGTDISITVHIVEEVSFLLSQHTQYPLLFQPRDLFF